MTSKGMRACVALAVGLNALGFAVGESLELAVTPLQASAPEGEGFVVQAEFTLGGDDGLQLLVPEHVPQVPFPRWRLVGPDGRGFVPYVPSFQTMWVPGALLGELVALEPGESQRFEQPLRLFVPEGAAPGGLEASTPLPLAPGEYRIEAVYAQLDRLVPYAAADFSTEYRAVPDLWTGQVTATPRAFRVLAQTRPQLRIQAPLTVPPDGQPFVLDVSLHNPGPGPLVLEGAARLGFQRMGLSAAARLSLGPDPRALEAGQVSRLTVAAGETLRWNLDAASNPVESSRLPTPGRLSEVLPQGRFQCTLQVLDREGSVVLRSNDLERFVRR